MKVHMENLLVWVYVACVAGTIVGLVSSAVRAIDAIAAGEPGRAAFYASWAGFFVGVLVSWAVAWLASWIGRRL